MTYSTVDALLQGNHWVGRNGHPVEGMFVHVGEGSRTSITSWFNNPESEASSHYLICKDGTRVRYVVEADTAWTNGGVNQPNRADPFINKWVANNINPNRRTVTIETERFWQEPLTKDMQLSLNELGAQLHVRYGWPNDGSRIWGHNEVDSVDRPNCPHLLPAEWNSLVAAVKGAPVVVQPPAPEVNTGSETYDMVTGKYVHPELWPEYRKGGLAVYGRPIAGAYMYSDGVIRQLFERVVLGVKAGKVTVEGLGQAWLAQTKLAAVQWPGVTPLK